MVKKGARYDDDDNIQIANAIEKSDYSLLWVFSDYKIYTYKIFHYALHHSMQAFILLIFYAET